jgi:DedD protein
VDRSVKERLVGAAVLVLLGVWLIPMILDGSPREEAAEQTALRLPVPGETPDVATDTRAKAPVRRTQTIDLAAAEQAVTQTEPTQAPGGSEFRDSAPEPTAVSAAGEKGAETKRASESPTEEGSASARAPGPAAASTGWMIQLGSFGAEDNARRQAQRIQTYGYDATITEFQNSGRTMYRVRVGPLPSRPSAEAAASSLSAHGFVAQVVAWD